MRRLSRACACVMNWSFKRLMADSEAGVKSGLTAVGTEID